MSSGSICPLTTNALVILPAVGLLKAIKSMSLLYVCACFLLRLLAYSTYIVLLLFVVSSLFFLCFRLVRLVRRLMSSPHNCKSNLINLTVTWGTWPPLLPVPAQPKASEGCVELNLCYIDELTIEQFSDSVITKHFGHGDIFQLCGTGLSVLVAFTWNPGALCSS